MTTILRNARILPGGSTVDHTTGRVVDIGIVDDCIRSISMAGSTSLGADRDIDLNGLLVLPGGVDPHVHVRDLGQGYKEDWSTAGAAALRGGFTTIFDMPNTLPPTETQAALDRKRDAVRASRSAAGSCARSVGGTTSGDVDARFWLGATDYNLADLEAILRENPADVVGIKIFLAGTSSNEVVHQPGTVRAVMQCAARHGVAVAVHEELQACLDAVHTTGLPDHASAHGRHRPRECTIEGTRLVCRLAAETGCTLYLVHVSTEEEVAIIREAKAHAPIVAEVTPHHLFLDDGILHRVGNVGKVNPPLREPRDVRALQQAVCDGVIDTVGSDHAPHTLDEKARAYHAAPSGFPGLETTFGLLLDAVNRGLLPLDLLPQLTSSRAARAFGLTDRGTIAEGSRADLVVIDPAHEWTVDPARFRTKARYSPFSGMRLTGAVLATVAAGVLVDYR